jgi:hypothetical protein
MAILNKVKDRYGDRPINFGWLDGMCHQEIF